MMCGAPSATMPATTETQEIADKVDVGEEKCVHLRVFEPLPHENKPLTLSSYQTDKEKHDELTYF
ncbi:cystatin B, isoform CRA_d [Rattus norvegicus]|uniref:Cystatin B, isoform CRA_d n=1 Tax=Rattus norvegicus TaxID=10116 RepID=A6JK24_RAT|nr:cystatin B, isoform CRA_d [Rattus norvegicus]